MKTKLKVFVILLIAAFVISSCGNIDAPTESSQDGLEYSVITVEGMPCILVQSYTYSGYYVKAITCDWSKWQGQ